MPYLGFEPGQNRTGVRRRKHHTVWAASKKHKTVKMRIKNCIIFCMKINVLYSFYKIYEVTIYTSLEDQLDRMELFA